MDGSTTQCLTHKSENPSSDSQHSHKKLRHRGTCLQPQNPGDGDRVLPASHPRGIGEFGAP